jgi:hypothetical protein
MIDVIFDDFATLPTLIFTLLRQLMRRRHYFIFDVAWRCPYASVICRDDTPFI